MALHAVPAPYSMWRLHAWTSTRRELKLRAAMLALACTYAR
jgi:hypothetical protein